MLVLIEGADKNGKTTLSKDLCAKLRYEYAHHGPPENGDSGYADQLLALQLPTVMDRSFIGEMVYGPLLRGHSCLSDFRFTVLLRLAARLGAVLIHCEQPAEIWQEWAKAETFVEREKMAPAREKFRDVVAYAKMFIPVIRYGESTDADRNQFIKDYMAELRGRRFEAASASGFTGIGCLTPSIILVGDRLNPNATWRGLPFDGGKSAEYLHKTLMSSKLDQRYVYIMNSHKPDGSDSNISELAHLSLEFNSMVKIVALGKEAGKWLARNGVAYYELEHPQHRARFKHDKMDEYVKQLEDIYGSRN